MNIKNRKIHIGIGIMAMLIFAFFSQIHAQSPLDSLNQIYAKMLEEEAPDRDKLPILKNLYEICNENDPYGAIEYAAQLLQIALTSGDSTEIGNAYNLLGDSYFMQNVHYLAMDYYFKAYEVYDKMGDDLHSAYSQVKIGTTYSTQNNDDIAIDYFNRANNVFRDFNDDNGLALVLENTGKIYLKQGFFDEALENFSETRKLGNKLKNRKMIAQANKLLASVYINQENYSRALISLKKALRSYKKTDSKRSLAETYASFGELHEKQEDYDRAFEAYNDALTLFEELMIMDEIAATNIKIGNIYFLKNSIQTAIQYGKAALKIANEEDLTRPKSQAYKLLSDLYIKKNDLKNAYQYLSFYSQIKDSLLELEKEEQFTELQVTFETQKKENEIEFLKKEKALSDMDLEIKNQELQKRRTLVYAMFAVLILIFLFALYYFYSYRQKQKANQTLIRQNEEITQQKKEILEQKEDLQDANKKIKKQNRNIQIKNSVLEFRRKEIQEQKEEIEEQSKKITASIKYASRIQTAIFPQIDRIKATIPESFIMFRPREHVSGDFYWYAEIYEKQDSITGIEVATNEILSQEERDAKGEPDKIIVAAVDCTGHGVPGAFMSMMGNTLLNQIVKLQGITEADKILNELHKYIRTSLHQEEGENRDGMDMSLCVIDKKNKALQFAGAANPLVYMQDGKMERIRGDRFGIGGLQMEKERFFTPVNISIEKPTWVYIYSDGYQDQFGGDKRMKFFRRRFNQMLFDIHKESMAEQEKILVSTLETWMGDHPQVDDILVIGMKL